ncbi:hypothetical protein QTL97_14440 [Sporosarcina thermotolerans]|uniref:Helix-turn-helix domain-containing protein n=1 Tax=Sporosarcina thermotolerans TaxID=633404 RepID=A0AAW9AES0_9BACL|nr:hypothetical protein [Sporosarcina thermotolerans]MDW0118131.1 hypothetical protein [Sporosarcina thermotolerans]WHT47624.1 hypothetical protein QNH10_15980 [Sporosarcina thermotolerans]
MYEKMAFDERAEKITERIFEDKSESILFFKVLVNYLDMTSKNKLGLDKLSESVLENSTEMKSYFSKTLKVMADIAVQADEILPVYTTGQLSKFFGVSITTINNWINEGKFIGVERSERNSQARISADTLWMAKTGKLYSVAQIVNEWEEEQDALGNNRYDSEEKNFLVDQMALYEKKYGGDFESTLGMKDGLSPEEETDAAAWSYFRRKFDAIRDDKSAAN